MGRPRDGQTEGWMYGVMDETGQRKKKKRNKLFGMNQRINRERNKAKISEEKYKD